MITHLTPIPIWLFSRSPSLTLFCLLFVGVMLIIFSFLIGVGNVELVTSGDQTKQVGYVFSLNWSFSFVLGFPMLTFFMLEAVAGQQRTLSRLVDRKMIVDRYWQPVGIGALQAERTRFWQRTTIIGLLAVGFSFTYCLVEWYLVSGRFLLGSATPIKVGETDSFYELDWSLAAALTLSDTSEVSSPVWNAVFGLVNYLLLAMYFSVVLAFYGTVILYAELFNRLSRGEVMGNLRIIPYVNDDDPRRGFNVFEPVFRRIIYATSVGFLLCYFMNVQNLYLRDGSANIGAFVLEEVKLGFSFAVKNNTSEGLLQVVNSLFEIGHILNVTSVWGIVIVSCVLWLIVFSTGWVLSEVARRSGEDFSVYVRQDARNLELLTELDRAECLARLKRWNRREKTGMQVWPFGWPNLRQLVWWLVFGVACIVLYRIGLVFAGITIGLAVLWVLGIFGRRD